MSVRKFSPYVEARDDARMLREATRTHWRSFCCKCSAEKPIRGGAFKGKGGAKVGRPVGGIQRRFICKECLDKMAEVSA